MSPPTKSVLGIKEIAALLGRSTDWLYDHLGALRTGKGFPPPIHGERPFVWVPVHVHAWLDRQLPIDLAEPVMRLRGVPPPDPQIEIVVDHKTKMHELFVEYAGN